MGNEIIRQKVKHGSLGYKILNYARFRSRQKDGTFSIKEYQEFIYNSIRPSYINRAIDSLVRNKHLQKLPNDRYKFTDSGALDELEHLYKETLWTRAKKGRHKNNSALREIDDIQSEDF
jgi:hypothetical protein